MRALLLGAGGQLGIDLGRECRSRGHEVHALCRDDCDIAHEESVRSEISDFRPDWVINAAAYNHVDRAEREPENALRVNALAVRTIAGACQRLGATLLHFSTDYVFGGDKDTPYEENDMPAPRSVYGVSKLAGELFAQHGCARHYVLRVAGLYGPPGRYTNRGNFVEFVLRGCAAGVRLRIAADSVASPTYGPAVSIRSVDILERRIPFGLYHLGGGQAVSWFEFARRIARTAACPADLVAARSLDLPFLATRPPYSALSNKRIEKAGIEPMPGMDGSLREYMVRRDRERPPE